MDRCISYAEAEKECDRLKTTAIAKTALMKEVGFKVSVCIQSRLLTRQFFLFFLILS